MNTGTLETLLRRDIIYNCANERMENMLRKGILVADELSTSGNKPTDRPQYFHNPKGTFTDPIASAEVVILINF